ncbi:DUF6438 domain-containing protein [Pontibacter vulgaris]|uniref:DUF6438 domain-containing protein n=1 Tax=Pontibacter vulgaris TaxID=2905679 RepID=UPI001FA6EF6C|nr:DUF6438 domain-containing protein [Pontibacter vulgaris]
MKVQGRTIKNLVLAINFILAGAFFMALPACNSSTANSTAKQDTKPAEPFILFQKTPCFGICPAYEASIATNGSITFIGWDHVPVIDTVKLYLAPQDLAILRKDVQQLKYKTLQDTYLTQWSDMPSTITTFYEKGRQVKKVKQEEGGPEQLIQFQDKLHKMIMKLVEEEAKGRLPKQ